MYVIYMRYQSFVISYKPYLRCCIEYHKMSPCNAELIYKQFNFIILSNIWGSHHDKLNFHTINLFSIYTFVVQRFAILCKKSYYLEISPPLRQRCDDVLHSIERIFPLDIGTNFRFGTAFA